MVNCSPKLRSGEKWWKLDRSYPCSLFCLRHEADSSLRGDGGQRHGVNRDAFDGIEFEFTGICLFCDLELSLIILPARLETTPNLRAKGSLTTSGIANWRRLPEYVL